MIAAAAFPKLERGEFAALGQCCRSPQIVALAVTA